MNGTRIIPSSARKLNLGKNKKRGLTNNLLCAIINTSKERK
jgi:hypothetical protein